MSNKILFIIINHPAEKVPFPTSDYVVPGTVYDIREELVLCGAGDDVSFMLLGGDTPHVGSLVDPSKLEPPLEALPLGTYVGDVDSEMYYLHNVRSATDAEILSIGRGINPL